jgi:1-deoxy-D-xylulose-5-phosphate synthase
MLSGSGLIPMSQQVPDKCFDVGIAEQHAVTFSAGMSTQGAIPFCNIYSTFMQRAYDQVVHDVAIQDLKVIFTLDRGGLVGADGATHHGCYDIAYMRCLPNLIVSAPMNEHDLRNLMLTAKQDDQTHPFVIRYPRGEGVLVDWRNEPQVIPIGKGRKLRDGEGVAILSYGHPGNFAEVAIQTLAAEGIQPAHYNLLFVKPLDDALLHELFGSFTRVVTVEDGSLPGGFGSAVMEWMVEHGYAAQITRLGIPDRVVHQGTPEELHAECGYDAAAIAHAVRAMVGVKAKV